MWNITENLMSKYKDLPQNSPQSQYEGSFHSVYLTSGWRGVFDEGVGEKKKVTDHYKNPK